MSSPYPCFSQMDEFNRKEKFSGIFKNLRAIFDIFPLLLLEFEKKSMFFYRVLTFDHEFIYALL